MNPLTLLSGPYGLLIKWGSIVLLAVGLFSVGYYKGYQHEKTVTVVQTVTKIKTQVKYLQAVEQPHEAKQIKNNKDRHDTAINLIPKDEPVLPGCPSPDWTIDDIRLLNSARPLPSEPR